MPCRSARPGASLMSEPSAQPPRRSFGRRFLLSAGLMAGAIAAVLLYVYGKVYFAPGPTPPAPRATSSRPPGDTFEPRSVVAAGKHLTVWWDAEPGDTRSTS